MLFLKVTCETHLQSIKFKKKKADKLFNECDSVRLDGFMPSFDIVMAIIGSYKELGIA